MEELYLVSYLLVLTLTTVINIYFSYPMDPYQLWLLIPVFGSILHPINMGFMYEDYVQDKAPLYNQIYHIYMMKSDWIKKEFGLTLWFQVEGGMDKGVKNQYNMQVTHIKVDYKPVTSQA